MDEEWIENYADRNHSTLLGIYRQSVEEQFYPYIRPQETEPRQTSVIGDSLTMPAMVSNF